MDFDFAQNNVAILSGLYGLLKPLDLMQPYRLEMGTLFKTRKWKNLYDFWGDKITEAINVLLKDDVLINLASLEYFKVIDKDLLNARIITPVFKENRNGTYKFVHIFGKKARGLMTRFIVQNGVYVTLKDVYYKIGQLITISKGGFAFLYIANGEKINGRFNVDLFSGTHAFYLRNIPFKTLSDFSQNNETPFIHGKIRRCGGQFDNLIKSQKTQLYRFIKSYKNK